MGTYRREVVFLRNKLGSVEAERQTMCKDAPEWKIREGLDAIGEDLDRVINQLMLHNKQP